MPGAKALAWAVVGLAALRKRKDQSTERQARADPFRPRPPAHGAGPDGPRRERRDGPGLDGPDAHGPADRRPGPVRPAGP